MAETKSAPRSPPTFLEVLCKSSGKTRRFAVGTDARFAVSLINGRLDRGTGKPLASYIEAFKEGEEPIAFGPNSVLVDYGHSWKLQTATEPDLTYPGVPKGVGVRPVTTRISTVTIPDSSNPAISFSYVGKIILAFILIFVLGAIFTLALENLPRLILFVKSSM
ncbi:uncharacterized protein LOC122277724 [Carya illinoinensis]|uniref:Uncharacterized protein n=1 Tax=Carya illinoinensis TaxID=32201 RepID=A0A8T1PP77_CARIL|nr:uncharacterized protein LOC122277724 [Carya illinoinensis]KAG6642812.1 hypothetical protein CIPAW_09G166900 [Carya illinoinensis]